MSTLDVILIVLTLGHAVAAIAAPRVAMYALPVVVPLLFAGWFGQLLLEQFYWQFVPFYFLVPASAAVSAVLGSRPRAGARPVVACAGLAVLAAISLLPLAAPPVPELPEPSGRHAVGSQTFHWFDEQRTAPSSPADRREVRAQAWYPAEWMSARQYLYTSDGDRLGAVAGIPAPLMNGYTRIDSHASAEVPVDDDRERWPVVLFSPAAGTPSAFYTALITDLASRGVVVFALDHLDDAGPAGTEADGAGSSAPVVFCADATSSGGEELDRAMAERQRNRADDLRFVIDQLTRPDFDGTLAGRLDTDHLAAVGHCLGGASALAALAEDIRIDAAVSIDGTPHGDLPDRALTRAVLLLDSDHDRTGPSRHHLDANSALLGRLTAPGHRYELGGAEHDSVTDRPFYLAGPIRSLFDAILGGSRDPVDTQRTTNALVEAFLREPFGEAPADLAATAAAHDDVTGGPVEAG